MPRYSSRRGYRSRRYKRSRKTLSKRNVYLNRSAKSQAVQIAALNRRVTRITRSIRPEVKVFYGSNKWTFNMDNSEWSRSFVSYMPEYPSVGSSEAQRVGDKIFIKTLSVGIQAEYYNNSTTGYHNGESAGSPMRIIIIKTVGPVSSNFSLNPNDLLEYSAGAGGDYTFRGISPFKRGVTTQFTVLYDKCVYLTTARNQLQRTIRLRNHTITWTDAGLSDRFIVYLLPCGLHFDLDFEEHIQGSAFVKMAYTDE